MITKLEDIERAREFAITMLGDQTYARHLDAVANIVHRYGSFAMVLAYLHSVNVKRDLLKEHFGDVVCLNVEMLKDEPTAYQTHIKLSKAGTGYNTALVVKAADRLSHITTCDEEQLKIYKQEHSGFTVAVYRPGVAEEIWEQLNATFLGDRERLSTASGR